MRIRGRASYSVIGQTVAAASLVAASVVGGPIRAEPVFGATLLEDFGDTVGATDGVSFAVSKPLDDTVMVTDSITLALFRSAPQINGAMLNDEMVN